MNTLCMLIHIVMIAPLIVNVIGSVDTPSACPSLHIQEIYCKVDFAVKVTVVDETVTYWMPESAMMAFGGFKTLEEMWAAVAQDETFQSFFDESARYRYNVDIVEWYRHTTEDKQPLPIVETMKYEGMHGSRLTPGKSYIIFGPFTPIPMDMWVMEATECLVVMEVDGDDPRESEILGVLGSSCEGFGNLSNRLRQLLTRK